MAENVLGDFSDDELVEILLDNSKHHEIDSEHLDGFLYFGISLYGHTNNSDLIGPLTTFYDRARSELSRETREGVYEAIVGRVETNDISINALLPFLYEETDKAIVSSAVIDYVMYRKVEDDEELAGVKDIVNALEAGAGKNTGAILGGLLLTGDRRITEMLAPKTKEWSTRAIIDELIHVHSGYTYATVVDFYLSWLDELNRRQMDAEFGALAAGLAKLLDYDQAGVVLEVERNFGLPTGSAPMTIISNESFEEFFRRAESSMQELAERESEPKLMPSIILAWREFVETGKRPTLNRD